MTGTLRCRDTSTKGRRIRCVSFQSPPSQREESPASSPSPPMDGHISSSPTTTSAASAPRVLEPSTTIGWKITALSLESRQSMENLWLIGRNKAYTWIIITQQLTRLSLLSSSKSRTVALNPGTSTSIPIRLVPSIQTNSNPSAQLLAVESVSFWQRGTTFNRNEWSRNNHTHS